jgi:hypothetical protein
MTQKKQLTEVLKKTVNDALAQLAQNPIAIITAVTETTISCKPVINRVVNGEEIEMPEFVEVPPVFLTGGETYEAYPLAVGDYCILMISERCYDLWYDGQDFRPPAEFRVHDYSDAFALVGLRNKQGAIAIPTDGRIWQIGDKYKEGNHEHVGDLTHTGNTTQTGDVAQEGAHDVTGAASVTGNHEAGSYSVGGTAGWNGAFATGDGRTATVVHGLITKVE